MSSYFSNICLNSSKNGNISLKLNELRWRYKKRVKDHGPQQWNWVLIPQLCSTVSCLCPNQTAFIDRLSKAGEFYSPSGCPPRHSSCSVLFSAPRMQLSTQSLETEASVTSSPLEDKYVDHWKERRSFHWFIEKKDGRHFLWLQHLRSPSTLTGRSDQYQCWYSGSGGWISLFPEPQPAQINLSLSESPIDGMRLHSQPAGSA